MELREQFLLGDSVFLAVPYVPKHKIRIVTAASLFDGHDAPSTSCGGSSRATGAEVIHLGHDRSVEDVVNTAIQEDAHAIAMTSYQGGHTEYFKYMHDLLKERGAGHIKIFGGGGGTILPSEIEELHELRHHAPCTTRMTAVRWACRA
jgi:methylmalonyl-CoA mutase